MEVEEVFVFSTEELPVVIEETTDLQLDSNLSSRRARSDGDCEIPRKLMGAIFKAKLMGASSSWSGFGVPREKLNIVDDDVTSL
ncbi:hypothetical protein ACOSP7_009997 [Xanthoceras sorbifolium]